MFSVRQPSGAALARLVAAQSGLELSYAAQGATAGTMPAGYRHDRWESDLGPYSDELLQHGAAALRSWRVQTGAGLTVVPAGQVEPGLTFAFSFRLPAGYVTAAG